jgi:hypothetical protein
MSNSPSDWAEFEAEAADPANYIAFEPVPRQRAHARHCELWDLSPWAQRRRHCDHWDLSPWGQRRRHCEDW